MNGACPILFWLTRSVVDDGGFTIDESYAYFSDDNCIIDPNYKSSVSSGNGAAGQLAQDYSQRSRESTALHGMVAGQDQAGYVNLTAGKGGEEPFMSMFYQGRAAVLAMQ